MDGDLLAAEQEAVAVSSIGGAGGGASGPHHRKQSTGSASMDSLMNIQQGNFSIGNVAWTSRAEVLATTLQTALHSQAAALCRHTLSRAGFQQIQLDCHFLRPQVQRMVENAVNGGSVGAAVAAIDEVLVVAAERCGEPVMLEPSVLDKMLSSAAQAQQQQQLNSK